MAIGHHGDFYNKTNFWQADRWEDLMKLVEQSGLDTSKVKCLLDVGCGSGKLTKKILELGIFPNLQKIVGVDIAIPMLETAKRENTHANIEYLELNAENIGAVSKKFEVVHSNFVLHWVENKQRFFEGLNRVTDVGSYFMLGTCQDLPSIFWDVDSFMRKEFGIENTVVAPFYYETLQGWVNLLASHGWRIEAASVRHDDHFTGRTKDFLDHWITASSQRICYGHWYDDMSDARKDELLQLLRKKYQYEDEDSFLFTEETLLLVAKRIS